jgi:apolipoprotein N-acyltransferase
MPLFQMAPTAAGFGLLVLSVVAVFMYGDYRLNEKGHEGTPFRASIVQGNIRQDLKWDPAFQKSAIDTYRDLTLKAVRDGSPDLVVWPETAVPFYFGRDERLTGELIDFQRGLGAYLLFGAITVKETAPEEGGKKLANSAIMLDPDGAVTYMYDKIHLVPFGEYVPLKRVLFFVDRLAYGIGEYYSGRKYVKGETPFGRFGTLICYEIIFPGLARKFYKDGGDFMVTITNDAWFGRTSGPYQHWSMAVLRAVENRKPVIRAANTGVSGFIDSRGRILQSSPIFEPAVLTAEVTADGRRSFYSRFGDLFSYLCMVAAITLLVTKYKKRSEV